MKYLFLAIGLCSIVSTTAQTVLSNAIITAKIEVQQEMSGNTEGMQMRTPGDTEIKLFLRDSLRKVVTKNDMFNSMIITNTKSGSTINLNESMGEKTGFTTNAADRADQKRRMDSTQKANAESGAPVGGMVVRMGGASTVKNLDYMDETNVINGINCKKAIATMVSNEGEESKVTVWYSTDYQLPEGVAAGRGAMNFTGLKGMPIQYQTSRTVNFGGNEMTMTNTYQVTKIEKEATITDKEFEVPKGYKVKSYTEWLKDNPSGMPQPVRMMIRG